MYSLLWLSALTPPEPTRKSTPPLAQTPPPAELRCELFGLEENLPARGLDARLQDGTSQASSAEPGDEGPALGAMELKGWYAIDGEVVTCGHHGFATRNSVIYFNFF